LPGKPQVSAHLREIEKLIKPYRDQGKLSPNVVKTAWADVKSDTVLSYNIVRRLYEEEKRSEARHPVLKT
jgi:hypothetical protein